MYSRGRVQGVCVCVNLSLVCAAASSGAESSWARSCSAQLSRGTLEITPGTGREEHHRVYACEREARDVIRPHEHLVWALGVPVRCSHSQ